MKASVHETLTTIAIDHCGDTLSNAMQTFSKEILRGVVAEDNATPERAFNWHFYRSNEKIPLKCCFFCKTTSKDIFYKRIKKMDEYEKDDKRRYKNLGRILHHIQDMSTPSHVIPIYHGLWIKDHFETFMEKQSNTDSLGKNVVCNMQKKDFKSLYKDAAEATLDYIKNAEYEVNEVDSNGDKTILHLDVFWQDHHQNENPKLKGFGTYGPLHNCFLSTALDNAHCPSIISHKLLLQIHTYICNKAIQDTCDALFYATALDNDLKDF